MDLPSCIDEKMLRDMYCGEDTRDATSKILGYLYQDLVAIEYLLDENVEFLCMECIEDIFFVRKSGQRREYNIVQVKYYPKTAIDKKGVLRDLYYQYIRMDKLGYKNTKLHLKYHCSNKVEFANEDYSELRDLIAESTGKHTCKDLVAYINEETCRIKKDDSIKKKKIGLEKSVIKRFSREKLFSNFQKKMKNGNDFSQLCESDYSNELSKKIVDFLKIKKEEYNSKQQQEILLGLAISRIHCFYQQYANEKDPTKKIIKPKDFWDYVRKSFDIPVETISAYIIMIMHDVEVDIYANLDDCGDSDEIVEVRKKYKTIFFNTEKWLNEITNNEDGIKSLIRTVFQGKELGKNSLFLQVANERTNIKRFLIRLIKIMFDIYYAQKSEGKDDVTLLDPATHCFDHSNCIIFDFELDCGTSMLLSHIESGMAESILYNMYNRLSKCKPKKWYMPGSCNFRGLKSYDSNVCEIIDSSDIVKGDLDVSNIHDGFFMVECMSCIKVDKRDWNKKDLSISSKFLSPWCEKENE